MPLNVAAIEIAYEKVDEAVARLKTLIANGATAKDIADQKAVVSEVVLQFQQVVGIKPMP
jgi:hypothetical protein